MNNGNFHIGYEDVGFKAFNVSRSYNSNSVFKGLFGFGWVSLFDTRLIEMPDGTVNIKLYGDGSSQLFKLPEVNKAGISKMVAAIIEVEINKNKVENTPVAILSRKEQLLTNKKLRDDLYQRYMVEGKIAPTLRSTTGFVRWFSFMKEDLYWDGKVYVYRNYDDSYTFNAEGRLVRYSDGAVQLQLFHDNKKVTGFRIDDEPNCTVTTDSVGRIIQIHFTDSGRLKQAQYKYDKDGDLVYSCDVANNEYWYAYDKNHMMLQVRYQDSSTLTMEYDPLTFWATRIKERSSSTTTYQYHAYYKEDGSIDDAHYATTLIEYDSVGKKVFTEFLEEEHKLQTADESYLYRIVHKTDTSYVENVYPPFVGNVTYRNLNGAEAWSNYDGKQRPVYLRLPDSVYVTKFNMKDLPEAFLAIDSLKKDTTSYSYRYNQQGELRQVEKNGKQFVIAGSVTKEKIVITQGNGSKLIIWYKNGQPIAVENEKTGKQFLPFSEASQGNARLLKLAYEEVSDIVVPKEIMHDWIWEKLKSKPNSYVH